MGYGRIMAGLTTMAGSAAALAVQSAVPPAALDGWADRPALQLAAWSGLAIGATLTLSQLFGRFWCKRRKAGPDPRERLHAAWIDIGLVLVGCMSMAVCATVQVGYGYLVAGVLHGLAAVLMYLLHLRLIHGLPHVKPGTGSRPSDEVPGNESSAKESCEMPGRSASFLTAIAMVLAALTALYPLSTVVTAGWHVAVTRFDRFGILGCMMAAFALLGWYVAFCYAGSMLARKRAGARAAAVAELQAGSRTRGAVVLDALFAAIGTAALAAAACLLAQSHGFGAGWLLFLGAGVAFQSVWTANALYLAVSGLRGASKARNLPAAAA